MDKTQKTKETQKKALIFLSIMMTLLIYMKCTAVSVQKQGKTAPPAKTSVSVREQVNESIAAKKPVFLYFYSTKIADSQNDFKKVDAIAKEYGAVAYKIEASPSEELKYSYLVKYAPTLFLIRPEIGTTGSWVVDMPENELRTALKKQYKPTTPGQIAISKAIKSRKPQLLFFITNSCGYCEATRPQIEKFIRDFSDKVDVITINVDREYELADIYGVNGVPVILIVDKGGLISRRTGYPSGYDDFRAAFTRLGLNMNRPIDKPKSKSSSAPAQGKTSNI